MKKYTLPIREVDKSFFDVLRQGLKTIETRAATDKYRQIKSGDILVFVCGKDKLEKRVKGVSRFQTIDELVKVFDFKKIMPLVSSVEEMKEVYYSFPGYRGKIEKFGLVALELE